MDEFAEFAEAHKRARARGATLTAACAEAGVSIKTACEWLARGRGEDPQRPRTKAYQAFGEAVQRGLNPTSLSSGAISTAEPVRMKENSAFSFIVERDSLVQRQEMISPWHLWKPRG